MVTREVAEAVLNHLKSGTGRSILSAPGTVQTLTGLGVSSKIDEKDNILNIGESGEVDLYTSEQGKDDLDAEGRGGRIEMTDELLLDELELGYELYRYCFDAKLNWVSRGRGTNWDHLIEQFEKRLAEMPS